MASKNNHSKSRQSSSSHRTTKARKAEAEKPVEPTNRSQGLTVVGIGASAGGLPALSSFFEALPADTGMAFVVITHLHPAHESHMAELLQRQTSMPIQQVTRKVRMHPTRRVAVSDRGRGFDASPSAGDRAMTGGLTNLQHQLTLLGCTMNITSRPGDGTQVMLNIPVQKVKR